MATHPIVPDDLDEYERMALYRQHQLTYEPNWFYGPHFARKDGSYSLSGIADLASMYPSTEELHDRASTRARFVGTTGGLGLSLLIIALGNSLVTPEEVRYSAPVEIGLYGLGSAALLTSLVAETSWHDPGEELAKDYNKNLLKELGLSQTARRTTPKTRVQIGLSGVSGTFW